MLWKENCKWMIMLASISLTLGWWSARVPVELHRHMKGWGGCGDGGPRRRFNVDGQLCSETRVVFTDSHQQMLYALEGESEDKRWPFKRDQDSGLYCKGFEGGEEEDTLSLCKVQEKKADGNMTPHVEAKELILKSQGAPKRVDFNKKHVRPAVPVVAVIGRPNVGKSSLVNRIADRHIDGAIVHEESGVTRDRTYRRSEFLGKIFDVVDTGGLVFDENNCEDIFADRIRDQAIIALREACAAIMVVDGQVGPTPLDQDIAKFLRKQTKRGVPVVLTVNKCESENMGLLQTVEFWSLGLGEPVAISALHGNGVAEVLESIMPHVYEVDKKYLEEGREEISIAIVGRPNVGKSSILNRLIGEDRAIVSDVAGTTRDAIDALVARPNGGQTYHLIDTAGVRQKSKVEYGNEFFMVNRAFKAIRRSDIVLLVLDATDGIKNQDRLLADRIAEEGRACIVVLNKWDAVEKDDKTHDKSVKFVHDSLPAVSWAPVIITSALTGKRLSKIFDVVDDAVSHHRTHIKTSILNEVLREAVLWQPPPARKGTGGISGRIYYCSQVQDRPPTIAVFCNNPKYFLNNYRRYLDRKFREQLGFVGTPLRFLWRGKRLRRVEQETGKVADHGRNGGREHGYPKPHAR